MLCKFDDAMRCHRCGFVASKLPHFRECQTIEEMARAHLDAWAKNRAKVPPLHIGSAIAKGLSSVGVSAEWVSRVTGVKDCGCKKRAAALDSIGEAASKIIERAANWAMQSILPYDITEQDVAVLARAIYESPLTNQGLKDKARSFSA